jgi:16S rRNA (adenine1518-N6/adenine1519-N6)-dimethyltransferase
MAKKKNQGARLGQHFLKNPHYAEVLVRAAGITKDDIALEIGPGEGMLTRELLKCAKKVIAVEKDEILVERLFQTFAKETASEKLQVIASDIRDITPELLGLETGKYVLAANIPYYITGELLRTFLEAPSHPRTIAFLMQKEVADRILSDKESILSLSVKVYGTARVAAKVTKGNFNPPPSVDSAILVVDSVSKKNFSHVNEKDFFKVVRAGFSAKRKMLLNNLSNEFEKTKVANAFSEIGINLKARAEDIHIETWLPLAEKLTA